MRTSRLVNMHHGSLVALLQRTMPLHAVMWMQERLRAGCESALGLSDCVLFPKFADCALHKLLHKEDCHQASKQLSSEAREAVDIVASIEDGH